MRTLRPVACSLLLACVSAAEAADLRFAHGLYRDKRWQLAADEYKSFLDANPNDAKAGEARFFLGESLMQLRRYADAAAAFERVTEGDSDYYKSALFRAGTMRKRTGDDSRALQSLEKFVGKFPDDGDAIGAWLMIAECRLSAKKTPEAERALRKVRVAVDAGSKWWGRLQLVEADLATAKGDGNAAVETLQTLAASNDPLAGEAASRMGSALFAAKRFAEAAAAFDRAALGAKDGSARQASYNAGLCYLELKRWTDAAARFSPIFQASIPDGDREAESLVAQAGRGLVQAKLGANDNTGARTIVDDALRRLGSTTSAWEFKRLGAELDLREGKSAEAAATVRTMLRDIPDGADAGPAYELACGVAAATFDAEWAAELLRAFPSKGSADGRRNAETALSETAWKKPADVASLLPLFRDRNALARLNYRLAALDLEASQPAKAVARLKRLIADESLGEDVRANANCVLGGALVQLDRWGDALGPLEAFLRSRLQKESAALDEPTIAAAKWWARSLTWLSDADAKQRIETLYDPRAVAIYEAVASSIAAERRSELALWLADKLPRESKAAAAIAARCLIDLKKPKEALNRVRNGTSAEENYLAGVASVQADGDAETSRGWTLLAQVADADPPTPWSLDAALRLARAAKTERSAADSERRLARLAATAKGADLRRVKLESAILAAELGRTLQAVADLKAFIEEEKGSPESVDAALKLAEIHESRGEAKQAEEAIAAAEQMDGGKEASGSLLFRRASIAYRNKDWRAAETLLAQFLAKHPTGETTDSASLMLGEAAMEQQKFADAERRFASLKESANPEVRGTATLRLAQAQLSQRKYDEAEATAEEFLKTTGQSESRLREGHFVRGRALMSRAKFGEARQAFEKAVADDDGELASKARFMVGETYFHQKRYEAAKKEYLKVAVLGKHDEWKALALLQVGKCHEQLGDRAAAAEDYRRVVEGHSGTPAAKQAKERLEEIAAGARKSDGNRVKE